jgi:hypothetical protein
MARPAAKERLPSQSILALMRTPISFSLRYAHTVPKTPIGTFARKTQRQPTSESSPPARMPRKEPKIPAIMFIPRARPSSSAGKASVMMAAEFAMSNAPPMAWNIRRMTSSKAPLEPLLQTTESRTAPRVNQAKPRLYIFVRPYMSPMRPTVTTTAADTRT